MFGRKYDFTTLCLLCKVCGRYEKYKCDWLQEIRENGIMSVLKEARETCPDFVASPYEVQLHVELEEREDTK